MGGKREAEEKDPLFKFHFVIFFLSFLLLSFFIENKKKKELWGALNAPYELCSSLWFN